MKANATTDVVTTDVGEEEEIVCKLLAICPWLSSTPSCDQNRTAFLKLGAVCSGTPEAEGTYPLPGCFWHSRMYQSLPANHPVEMSC